MVNYSDPNLQFQTVPGRQSIVGGTAVPTGMNTSMPLQGQQTQPQFQQSQGPILVMISSEDEMARYPVAAGATVYLMAMNLGSFWVKTTDANGIPLAPRKFKFNEEVPEPPVTRAEFESLSERLNKLIGELGGAK